MLEKNILILIIQLILVVTVTGVPIKNTSNEPTGTGKIAIKVPPEEKNGTSRPMLFVYPADPTTDVAPTSNGQNTEALDEPIEKDGKPRPIFIVYPPTSSTSKTTDTVTPTKDKENDTPKVQPVEQNSTPRPILFIYPPGKSNSTETTTTTESSVPMLIVYPPNSPTPKTTDTVAPTKDKENITPRPIVYIYPPGKPNNTETTTTTESTVPMLILYPPTSHVPKTTDTVAPTKDKENITPRPILYIYPPGKPNNTETTTTTESTVPMLILYPPTFHTPKTTDTVAPPKDKENDTPKVQPVEKNSAPRPILFIYPPGKPNSTETTTTTTTTTTETATYDTSRPMIWINSDVSPSSNETVKRPENFLRGYHCRTRKGFYRYPGKCDVYIECKDYTPLTYICPDGLYFNPNARRPEHVCDDPSVVNCENGETKPSEVRPVTRPTPGTARQPWSSMDGFSCPSSYGYFKVNEQCDEYVECRAFTPVRYICPDGLHFKTDALWTEYPCVNPLLSQCGYY